MLSLRGAVAPSGGLCTHVHRHCTGSQSTLKRSIPLPFTLYLPALHIPAVPWTLAACQLAMMLTSSNRKLAALGPTTADRSSKVYDMLLLAQSLSLNQLLKLGLVSKHVYSQGRRIAANSLVKESQCSLGAHYIPTYIACQQPADCLEPWESANQQCARLLGRIDLRHPDRTLLSRTQPGLQAQPRAS